jgi:hypothetical protein
MIRKMQYLTLIVFILTACETITIKNRTAYTANGVLSQGATCSDTINDNTQQVTMDQALDVLEARPSPLPDPCHSGSVMPAHPAAVFEPAADFGTETEELEQMCRMLGNDCTYAVKQTISRRRQILSQSLGKLNSDQSP